MFKFDETLMLLVRHDLENGNIPMLLGEPGIGKSSWVEDLAKTMNTTCFTLACNQLADKADLTGARLVPCGKNANGEDQYKQTFYPHAVIQEACQYAEANPREYPILFMDELNRTTPDVTSEALSIPTMRKIGSTRLPANLRIVTAGNDKGNITSLDTASISRFVLYPVAPDKDTFIRVNPELNEFIKRVLNAHPEVLFCKDLTVNVHAQNSGDDDEDGDQNSIIEAILEEGDEMVQMTTPRTLTYLSKWLNSFTNQELNALLGTTIIDKDGKTISVLEAGVQGHVGRTNFSTLLMSEIANGIMTIQNQTNVASIQKPNCYDMVKAAQDMTQLNAIVSGLAKNELAALGAYLITENADNKVYLNAVMPYIDPNEFTTYYKILFAMNSEERLDSENLNAAAAAAGTANPNVGNMLNVLTMC